MRYKDKIVLITGSGSGIGKAAAIAFAKEGATLIVSDINNFNLNLYTNFMYYKYDEHSSSRNRIRWFSFRHLFCRNGKLRDMR